MKVARTLIAGLGGAIALNLLHESLKKTNSKMPRIDLLGEEALQKGLERVSGKRIQDPDKLYIATLGADLFSNALYYSAIGAGGSNVWPKAVILGLTAGAGAVKLPRLMGLNPFPVNKTAATRSLTVGYYLFGALVTAAILSNWQEKE